MTTETPSLPSREGITKSPFPYFIFFLLLKTEQFFEGSLEKSLSLGLL